jgi:hypothetical protein
MREWFKGFMLGFTCVFRPDPIKYGIATSRGILFMAKCLVAGVLFGLCVMWITSCASEIEQRQHWQDCAGVFHEACRDADNFQACEYEYYKECINV